MDLISIIVPVYNVEDYLDACIDSIVNQTYYNLEIILVDDGSDDSCPMLCDCWAQRDSRIKVIHKENGGASSARNAGIDACTGKYIGFVDSDDIISPYMYEKLYKLLTGKSADFVQCGMILFSDTPFRGFPHRDRVKVSVLNPAESVNLLLSGDISSTCPNTLSERNTALSTKFDVGMINEDVMWVYRMLVKSAKTVVTDEELYAYYQRPGSVMNSSYSEKRFDAIKALRMRADSIKKDFPSLYPAAERTYAGVCMYHYQTVCRCEKSEEYEEYKKRLFGMFCGSDLDAVYSVTDLKYKLWYTAFRLLPDLTCKIRNMLRIGL